MAVQIIKANKSRKKEGNQEKMAPEKLRVAAYCRVSTDQEEQESSYEAQCTHYLSYIRNHPQYELAGIYADEGISGTSTRNREQFNQMIRDCDAGKIDVIITKSISRFSRNTLDCLQYIRRLKSRGIPILFEKEAINTMDVKGEVLITIMASIAQQESQSISQNVRLGIQYRFQQGQGRVNAAKLLGLAKGVAGNDMEYKGKDTGQGKLNETAKDTLVIVPGEAEIVRRIYREFLEGYSPGMIARHLEESGVPTSTGGKKWYPSTVVSILKNEKYAGDLLLQKYYTVDFLTHKVVKNTGELPQYYVENHHPPIVPKQIFQQAQGEFLRRASLKYEPGKLRFGSRFALKGRVICGKCGRILKRYTHYTKGKEQETEWRCRKRSKGKNPVKREMPSACSCSLRNVRESDVKEAVLEAFNMLPRLREDLMQMKEGLQGRLVHQQKTNSSTAKQNAEVLYELMQIRILLELIELLKNTGGEKHEEDRGFFSEVDVSRREGRKKEREIKERKEVTIISPMPLSCEDYEDFFRRTKYQPPENIVDNRGIIIGFDDEMVIRYLESVTVLNEGYSVRFKAGLSIKV